MVVFYRLDPLQKLFNAIEGGIEGDLIGEVDAKEGEGGKMGKPKKPKKAKKMVKGSA